MSGTRPQSNESCFFFNDTATTEIYTLSLHDALPISTLVRAFAAVQTDAHLVIAGRWDARYSQQKTLVQQLGLADRVRFLHNVRSEEHTSELQSRQYLVCRLLLEKKKSTEPFI